MLQSKYRASQAVKKVSAKSPMSRTDRDWERMAQRDPYYAVITDPRYRQTVIDNEARQAFFESGRTHVARLFSIIESEWDTPFRPGRTLDFGCGVGRTLIPLAERSGEVVGFDVAPSMLAEAREVCASRANITLVGGSILDIPGQFDLIHAWLVFQHVPVRDGESFTRDLLARLSDNGVAVLHYTYARRASWLRRWGYRLRVAVPPIHSLLNVAAGRSFDDPLMQANCYDLNRLYSIIQASGCGELLVRFTDHQGLGYLGVAIICRKRSPESL